MVYEPEEDSVMLAKEVERFAKGNMLDMGTGTGIIAKIAAKKESVKSVIAVDIDKQAIDFCKNKYKNETILKKIKFIQSDLFKNIKEKFDFIVFNPPYLPYDPDEPEDLAIATTGGKYGFELTHKFLDQALEHLEITGSILLLFSTLTKKRKVEEKITELLLEFEKISELKISFETLYVYRIRRSNLLIELKKLNIKNIKPLTHGHRGVIYTGNWKDKKITIKAKRTDIDAQGTVNIEAQQLEKLNKYKIGPRILEKKDDFFIYEYVNGEFILDYFEESFWYWIILIVGFVGPGFLIFLPALFS